MSNTLTTAGTAQVKFSRVCANLSSLSSPLPAPTVERLGGAWTTVIGPVDVVTADDKADCACACIYTTLLQLAAHGLTVSLLQDINITTPNPISLPISFPFFLPA